MGLVHPSCMGSSSRQFRRTEHSCSCCMPPPCMPPPCMPPPMLPCRSLHRLFAFVLREERDAHNAMQHTVPMARVQTAVQTTVTCGEHERRSEPEAVQRWVAYIQYSFAHSGGTHPGGTHPGGTQSFPSRPIAEMKSEPQTPNSHSESWEHGSFS